MLNSFPKISFCLLKNWTGWPPPLFRLGVRKIRLTGGEPLVRKNVVWLVERLSRHLRNGTLDELTLTSNGTQLARFADQLAGAGVERINISLDTRDPQKFKKITRLGKLSSVRWRGLMQRLKPASRSRLNMVAIKGFNDQEIAPMMEWAHGKGMDLTLIEVMPFGDGERWLPNLIGLDEIRSGNWKQKFTLEDIPTAHRWPGPLCKGQRNRRAGWG